METLLLGLAVSIITWLSGFLKLSKTNVSIGLCFIGGAIYYVMTTYYSATRQELAAFSSGIYATSQLIYNIIKKRGILDKAGF